MAEELQQLREQIGEQAREANRASEALFWSSFLVGACIALVAVAGTACSIMYLRRHVNLLATDSRERLRPALARTECRVEEARDGDGTKPRRLVFEITNVGAVAAVGVRGRVRHGTGKSIDSLDDPQSAGWSFGALAPGLKQSLGVKIRTRPGSGADDPFWLEVTMEYEAIGGRPFRYHATCEVRGSHVLVIETVP